MKKGGTAGLEPRPFAGRVFLLPDCADRENMTQSYASSLEVTPVSVDQAPGRRDRDVVRLLVPVDGRTLALLPELTL